MNQDQEISRICRMEALYDRVSAAYARGAALSALASDIRELTEYMDGGQWLRDYEKDERGGWPADLRRGVLSQDGLYNLLTELEEKQRDGARQ